MKAPLKMWYAPKRWIAGSLIAAALTGVTLLPITGWLVRQQGQALFSGPASPWRMNEASAQISTRQTRAAHARPDDFPLQLALALRAAPSPAATSRAAWVPSAKLQALHGLEATYSDRPSLYAAILRDMSLGAVKLDHRKDQFDLQPPRADVPENVAAPIVHMEALREWERAAMQGEKADPTNAFFPFLRAVGLFAQNRDAEAVVEIEKAATLPRYDDYVRDDATGGWALAEAGQNGAPLSSVSRVAISAAVLLPHYALMRGAARLAAVQAVHQEKAGNREAGFAIRQSLVRCGARLRTDSNWLIGNFVGEAIAALAQARPGGAPPLPKPADNQGDRGDRYALQMRKNYEAYLNRIGHPEEIAWVEHEAESRQEIKVITNKGLDKGPSSIAGLVSLMGLWFVGMALISNALWMLLLGAAATRLVRTRRIQNGDRLHTGVAWGLGLFVLPVGLIAAGKLFNVLSGTVQIGVVEALALGVPALTAVACLCRRDRIRAIEREQARQLGHTPTETKKASVRASGAAVAATMASVALMAGLLVWMSGGISSYASTINMIIGVSSMEADDSMGVSATLLCLVSLAGMVSVPALTWTVFAIRSRIRRVPVSVGVVRGFSRVALPIAAVLSLLYVGTVCVTGAREQEAQTAIQASVEHEGRACAAIAGRTWPTFAP